MTNYVRGPSHKALTPVAGLDTAQLVYAGTDACILFKIKLKSGALPPHLESGHDFEVGAVADPTLACSHARLWTVSYHVGIIR